MKVLAIKQPWASLIANGDKTIEVRSRNMNIRERIAIYATRSNFDKRGKKYYSRRSHINKYIRGYIIATAELTDSVQYIKSSQFVHNANQHIIPLINIEQYMGHYAWCLSNVQKLKHPIKFKMKKGCVVWDWIDNDEIRMANMDVIR